MRATPRQTPQRLNHSHHSPKRQKQHSHYPTPSPKFYSTPNFTSETWSLACTLSEIRAGAQLFASFNTQDEILRQIVQTLGKLPEPWWSAWEARSRVFDEEGRPHPHHKREDGIALAVEYLLLAQIRDIGAEGFDDKDHDSYS